MNVLRLSTSNKNFTRASEVIIPEIYNRRFKTGKESLDYLFGGSGFLPGFTFTLAAAPGTGKTSFLLQMLDLLEHSGKKTAYISGEESIEQLAFTSRRLGVSQVPLANITSLEEIEKVLREQSLDFVVLDSFPALTTSFVGSRTAKEEYIVSRLIQVAKEKEVVIGTILHFTKGGTYKGGTLLSHSVDANLLMHRSKDDLLLREMEVTKNRFGSSIPVAFRISDSGFTFEPEEIPSSSEPLSKKDIIIKHLSSPQSFTQLLSEMDISSVYLNSLLKNLINQGKVRKKGKGPQAIYSLKEKKT